MRFKISSIKKKLKLKNLLSKLDNYGKAELEDLGVKSNKLAVYLIGLTMLYDFMMNLVI